MLIPILLLLAFPLFGQESVWTGSNNTPRVLEQFISIDPGTSFSPAAFESFLEKLEKKRESMSEKEFLHYIFAKTHQTYLKKYVPYASFGSLFSDGTYHCLTGTILYSIILDHFNIDHEVIETNYHIFLMVNTKEGKVLMETTDPESGFVDSPEAIDVHLNTYRQQVLQTSKSGSYSYYRFSTDLFRSVSLKEMAGLLYYNMSVDLLNKGNLIQAIEYAAQANELYSSQRMDEFRQILLLTLQQSKLESEQKKEYMKILVGMKQHALPAVASLH